MSKVAKMWVAFGVPVLTAIFAVVAYLGFGTCIGEGAAQVCSVAGFNASQVANVVTMLLGQAGISAYAVYKVPNAG